MSRFRFNEDVLAGVLFGIPGLVGVIIGHKYEMGTLGAMGPGYLPFALSIVLLLIAASMFVKGIVSNAPNIRDWAFRPLFFICITFVVFSILIGTTGLAPASIVAMIVAALGSNEFNLREQMLLAIVVSIVASLVFVWGLGLPLKVLPYWLWIP